jgi:hypothetical protein
MESGRDPLVNVEIAFGRLRRELCIRENNSNGFSGLGGDVKQFLWLLLSDVDCQSDIDYLPYRKHLIKIIMNKLNINCRLSLKENDGSTRYGRLISFPCRESDDDWVVRWDDSIVEHICDLIMSSWRRSGRIKIMEDFINNQFDSAITDEEIDDLFKDIFDPMITGIGDMQNVNLADFLED